MAGETRVMTIMESDPPIPSEWFNDSLNVLKFTPQSEGFHAIVFRSVTAHIASRNVICQLACQGKVCLRYQRRLLSGLPILLIHSAARYGDLL